MPLSEKQVIRCPLRMTPDDVLENGEKDDMIVCVSNAGDDEWFWGSCPLCGGKGIVTLAQIVKVFGEVNAIK